MVPGRVALKEEIAQLLQQAETAQHDFRDTGDPHVLNRAVDAFDQAVQHPGFRELPLTARCAILAQLGQTLDTRHHITGRRDDLEAAISAFEKSASSAPSEAGWRASLLESLGHDLHRRYNLTQDLEDLDAALKVWKQALDVSSTRPQPPDVQSFLGATVLVPATPERASLLNSLGVGLRRRYAHSQNAADIDEAISALEQAVDTARGDVPELRAQYLSNLGSTLRKRHGLSGALTDLDAAAAALRHAVDIAPAGMPGRAGMLHNLGNVLRDRHVDSQSLEDLTAAAQAYEQAVDEVPSQAPDRKRFVEDCVNTLIKLSQLTGHDQYAEKTSQVLSQNVSLEGVDVPLTPDELIRIGERLRNEFTRTGEIDALNRAIAAFQNAVQLGAHDTSAVSDYLDHLGLALLDRFRVEDQEEDLQAAIKIMQRAVDSTSGGGPGHADRLSNLAVSLLARYDKRGVAEDLAGAIAALEQADAMREVPTGFRARCLTNLGICWRKRYELYGQPADLDRAVKYLDDAVGLTPSNAPEGPGRLNNLANGLAARAARDGSLSDLNEAIEALRKALGKTAPSAPAYAQYLVSLSGALGARYRLAGGVQDLEEATKAAEEANASSALGLQTRAKCLVNLGGLLVMAFTREGRPEDLDAAVSNLREAVQFESLDSGSRADTLSNLGSALLRRYWHSASNSLEDLTEAVESCQEAVDMTPLEAPARGDYLTTLGLAFRYRYTRDHRSEDLDDALVAARGAVAATESTEAARAGRLLNLASVLVECHTRDKRPEDLAAAQADYREALSVGIEADSDAALNGARNWGDWALGRSEWKEAAEAYDYGAKAAQRLCAAQLLRRAKERWLREARSVATNGAYAFARCGDPARAVQMVEDGRVQLLAESLERNRGDLERLREVGHGDLLQRYRTAAAEWEWLSARSPTLDTEWSAHVARRDQLESYRGRLDALIDEIRGVSGYEKFLTEVDASEIQAAAAEWPLVYIVSSPVGGVAFIVQENTNPPQIKPVWLPKLNLPILREKLLGSEHPSVLGGYFGAYANRRLGDTSSWEHWLAVLEETTRWLWDSVMGELVDAVGALPPVSPNANTLPVPQATLVPTGLLGLLPLHAAWCPDAAAPSGRRFALDTVAWRYVPSARTVNAVRARLKAVKADNVLLVEEPLPVSATRLRFARAEVANLKTFWPKPERAHIRHSAATHEAVSTLLPQYAVLHYAGHALADWRKPGEGGLLLAEDRVLTVRELQGMHLRMRLAVLSACETGVPGTDVPDEMIGLPTSLMEAGVAGVVASLWSVPDVTTMQLMKDFYTFWRDPVTNLEPAQALRKAQLVLRSDRAHSHPYYWAAFAYTGA